MNISIGCEKLMQQNQAAYKNRQKTALPFFDFWWGLVVN